MPLGDNTLLLHDDDILNKYVDNKFQKINIKQYYKQNKKSIYVWIFAILLLIGGSFQAASLPYWEASFPSETGGSYFIICFAALIAVVVLSIPMIIIKIIKKYKVPSFKKFWLSYFAQGLSNQLNGIFVIYAASMYRTPPVLMVMLQNTGVFWSIITRSLLVRNKKINYCSIKPFISLLFLSIAIFIMMLAKIFYDTNKSIFSWTSIFWTGCATIGAFFGTLYNTIQEKYLDESGKILNTSEKKFNYIYTVVISYICQILFMILFFWVDIIPGFGYSNIYTFLPNLFNSIKCYFNGLKNFLLGSTFCVGFLLTYVSSSVLNEDSSGFVMYVNALQTPFCAVVFYIIQQKTQDTPIWAAIPSLILIFIGVCIWKYWESHREQSRSEYNPV